MSVKQRHNQIRSLFKSPCHPNYFIPYKQFNKHIKITKGLFLKESLDIVDTHLRFRWFVRYSTNEQEQMAQYKWIPLLATAPLLLISARYAFFVPVVWLYSFDFFFENFFIWKHSQYPLINVRKQFAPNLGKHSFITRRLSIYDELKSSLNSNAQIPAKYIKFGQYTEYLLHCYTDQQEVSSFKQTTLYETYLLLKDIKVNMGKLLPHLRGLLSEYMVYRRDPERKQLRIDTAALVKSCRMINPRLHCFNNESNVEHNIRRLIELYRYAVNGRLQYSQFNIYKYSNLDDYTEILEPHQYNIKSNFPDLLMYYCVIMVPHLFRFLLRR